MQRSSNGLRKGWIEAGQGVARSVVLICIVGLAAMFGAAQMGYGKAGPPPGTPQAERTVGSNDLYPTPQTATATASNDSQPTPQAVEPTISTAPQSAPTDAPLPTPAPPTLTPVPEAPRVGIVAGHWWLDESGQQSLDVGAVCDEGTPNQLTEVTVNKEVAERVVRELRQRGYQADLLQEWDDRLPGYRANVLVSIHTDACTYPDVTGFKVARVVDSHVPEIEDRLVACLVQHYGQRTGLPFHEGSITHDMTQYHTFYEINPNTPGAIIETGFMSADRWLLTQRADLVAQGIIDGILCFLEGEGKIHE